MRAYVVAFTLAMTTVAAAQSLLPNPLPKTIKLNDSNGQPAGTGTLWGNTMVLRDTKGELMGTVTFEANGERTFRDPNGQPIGTFTFSLGDPSEPAK
jgi:hypothetical protein